VSATEFTDKVRQALALSSLIGERVKLRRRGQDFVGLCPFHAEKSPSFTVNDTKGRYYCFGCGAKGDHFEFVMQTQGMTFPEAMTFLSDRSHIPLPPSRQGAFQKEEESKSAVAYGWMNHVAEWYQSQLKLPAHTSVYEYVIKRGIKPQTMDAFKIGYAPVESKALWKDLSQAGATHDDLVTWGLLGVDEERKRSYDRFRNRLMVPICDTRGRVVAFGGRLMEGQGPKYLNSPETPLFHKGDMLFAQHMAAGEARKRQELFIVEGYFDVIGLYDRGIKNAVAPLGTGFTSHQLQLAWALCPEPTICFDGDEAGRRAASRILEFVFPLLKVGCSLNFMFLPPGEDPDSFVRAQGAEAFLKLQESKVSLIDYLWHEQMSLKPLTTPERRADFAQRLRVVVSSIPEPQVKNAYGQEIRQRLDELHQSQGRFAKRAPIVPQVTLRLSKNLPVLQQKILLAIALNHPEVVSDDVEVFTAIPFSDEVLNLLKNEIIVCLSQGGGLDKGQILTHLEGVDMASHVSGIIDNRALAVHAKFCLPETPVSQVKEGWRELIFQIIKRTELKRDIQNAKLLLQETMTQEQWHKLKALIVESRSIDTDHEPEE
jgi:DNA primase